LSAKSCLGHEPVRQAHGPEVLEGSEAHLSFDLEALDRQCGYSGTTNIWATATACSPGSHVIGYFCRIGVKAQHDEGAATPNVQVKAPGGLFPTL